MIRYFIASIVQRLIKNTWRTWERLGFYIIPNHFYGPIPNTTELLTRKPWAYSSDMVGIDFPEADMVELACKVFPKYGLECADWPHKATGKKKPSTEPEFYLDNEVFQSGDAEILYAFIRHFKPRLIVEVGSGFSTLIASQASAANEKITGKKTEIVAIEPYPAPFLRLGIPYLARLITKKVQDIELQEFQLLHERDILFIDSTHIVKAGSDVNYLFLEVLPRLKKGVIVHIHDIFLPRDYTRKMLVDMHIFFTEQYLLHAFLMYNESWKVLWASAFMHYLHADLISSAFPTYEPHIRYGGSFWIQKVK